jgi:hypothetical protein
MLAGLEEAFQVRKLNRAQKRMTPLRALLEGLIDYAGLFPPASLDMKTAVRNYSAYRASDEAWMLGRFIVPVQRLDEFSAAFAEVCCDEQVTPWLLSVLSAGDAAEDARLVSSFSEGAVFLDALEFKAGSVMQVEQQLRFIPQDMAAYVEITTRQSGEMLPILKKSGASGKIRTGGITADVIPSAEEITNFLVACSNAKVPFKATAGLHHPLRSMQRLTYEENSATVIMHGFVNVFVAAAIAYQGAPVEQIIDVLQEQVPSAFHWEKTTLRWRDHRLSTKQVKAARQKFAIGFGSCSFDEPVRELNALGWL